MKIEFTYTQDDFRSGLSLMLRQMPIYKLGRIAFLIMMTSLVLSIPVLVTIGDRVQFHVIVGWLRPAVVGLVVLVTVSYIFPRVNARRSLNIPTLKGQRTIKVTAEGLSQTYESGNSFNNWESFVKYLEDSQTFLLYYSDQSALLVPKRALTPEGVIEFSELLKQKIGGRHAVS